MLVSIVLPAHNEEETIEHCLRSLIKQFYEEKEIIVVNDGSTDDTGEIVENIAKEIPNVTLIDIDHSGRSHARNEGLKLSKGDLVFFAEADAIYDPDYLAKAVENFEDSLVGGILIEGEVWEGESFISGIMQAEVKLRNTDLRSGRSLPKGAWVYRRDILARIGGFDESLKAGEDSDLGDRLRDAGHRIKWIEGVSWRFKSPETLQELLTRDFWFGKEEVMGLYKKYPKKYPWFKTLLAILFGVSIMATGVYWAFLPWVFGSILVALSLKIASIFRRGRGVIEAKYAIALGILGPVRFVAFFAGNVIGLLASVWSGYQ